MKPASANNYRHGHNPVSGATPEYNTWCHMNGRCSNPKNKDFERYGARGISVCERWRESFVSFLEDMGAKPSPTHTIDRIDNDGNYEPSNCRWATPREQASNHRRSRIIEYRGERKTLAEWARHLGIKATTIHMRVASYGWTMDRALSTPAKKSK